MHSTGLTESERDDGTPLNYTLVKCRKIDTQPELRASGLEARVSEEIVWYAVYP